jgi:hypothetical protein
VYINARQYTPDKEAKMNTVRLNITLPKDIAAKLDSLAGSKGKSSFIAECIQQRVSQIEQQKLSDLKIPRQKPIRFALLT